MDDEEETLQRYGTPLEPLDEDEIPAKKPISIEDQIVTDENGKRRFHGAFTGGFSAGFWNTVGSLEGWKPTEFKSSRSEKASQRVQQKPEDFMDDEDLGEFGIAPQRIQAQSDFQIESATSSRKRKFLQSQSTTGPIPGVPVLAELLRPVEDKIAVRILKSMGWKPGQGIGPRLTSKQKRRTRERNKREEYVLKRYGCMEESGKNEGQENITAAAGSSDDHDDDDDDDNELTFAPDDYDTLMCTYKTNRFGLGYTGLSHDSGSGGSGNSKPAHFNLFGPLEVLDKNNKKLSIRGQAFGVGALEEEDEDIYARDDLSKYDFSLEERKAPKPKAPKHVQDRHVIDGFATAKHDVQYQSPFIVEPPAGFQPRNWAMRKSRFAPLPREKRLEIEASNAYKKAGLGRHDLNPAERSAILEEQLIQANATATVASVPEAGKKPSLEELQAAQKTRNERTKSLLERISAKSDNFTRGGIINTKGEEVTADAAAGNEMTEVQEAVAQEQQFLLSKASNMTKCLDSSSMKNTKFKPFLGNESKQQRYEKFLEANLSDETEIGAFLATIQPVELSAWDREMERKEFMQARKIYKPLGGIMSERFVSETALAVENPPAPAAVSKQVGKTESDRIIVLKRTKEMWKPHALLCKRYNIAEPFGGNLEDTDLKAAKKAKLSIFDYLETSVNRKENFQTPIIIPKHIEKPKAVVNNRTLEADTVIAKEATPLPPTPSTPPPTTVPNDPKPFKLPPKTELEKRVEESRDKPPSEKVELFRAIFEDSDDDEAEQDSTSNQTTEKVNSEIETLDLPTTSKQPLSAAAVNLLRNTSPPRGIFAALFSAKTDVAKQMPKKATEIMPQKNGGSEKIEKSNPLPTVHVHVDADAPPTRITFKSRSERQQETDNSYGPRLPANLSATAVRSTVDSRLQTLYEKHKSKAIVEDVWVERTGESNSDSSSESSSSSESDVDVATNKRRKKKSKKSKKSIDKSTDKKKKMKKLKKKTKTKKKAKKKKNK